MVPEHLAALAKELHSVRKQLHEVNSKMALLSLSQEQISKLERLKVEEATGNRTTLRAVPHQAGEGASLTELFKRKSVFDINGTLDSTVNTSYHQEVRQAIVIEAKDRPGLLFELARVVLEEGDFSIDELSLDIDKRGTRSRFKNAKITFKLDVPDDHSCWSRIEQRLQTLGKVSLLLPMHRDEPNKQPA
jgi:glycine cleavage system regulatory protein